jgi:hypothetical protein
LNFNGDYSYAWSRVQGCFLWHRPSERLCRAYDATSNYRSIYLEKANGERFEARWKDISFEPPVIKAVNLFDDAFYVERIPLRRDWKQGIRASQFSIIGGDSAVRRSTWLNYNIEAVERAIKGIFPSFKDILFKLEEYANLQAVSKHFFINKDFNVIFQNRTVVGQVTDDNLIRLHPNFSFFKEQIETELGPDVIVESNNR